MTPHLPISPVTFLRTNLLICDKLQKYKLIEASDGHSFLLPASELSEKKNTKGEGMERT